MTTVNLPWWFPDTAVLALVGLLAAFAPADSVQIATQRYDNQRTGSNLSEKTLNISNVNSTTFGKLFSRDVDDEIYAQPLYIPNVKLQSGTRNVLYVATTSNSVYAFDADDPNAFLPLWHVNLNGLIDAARPVAAGEVGRGDWCTAHGGYKNFSNNIGIVGTPVIDIASQTLYVVARTNENGAFVQRLHALDITTGAARPHSPVVIRASVAGTGDGTSNGIVSFNPQTNNQRGALLLANGILYITWASHCDAEPYHGWIMGYDPKTLTQVFARTTTPNGRKGGIWQSNSGPSVDDRGKIYITVGDGTATAPKGGQDYGNAILKLSPSGEVIDWFIPFDYEDLNENDVDVGSTGALIIPKTNLIIVGSKAGKLYLLNRHRLGHFQGGADRQIVQSVMVAPAMFSTPTYWRAPDGSYVYTWCSWDYGKAFRLHGNRLKTNPSSKTTMIAEGLPGAVLAISADGRTAGTGILWAVHALGDASEQVAPGILRAFDASDLSRELWNSKQNAARDELGNFAKFNTPVVANGKVYVATFSKKIAAYGLLPKGDRLP